MREGLLVDAYNLLYAARASAHARLFPDIKRLAFFLEHYASHHGLLVVLAVDGTRFKDELGDTPVMRVIHSDGGVTADALMESWMARLAPAEKLAWVLVSNDVSLCRMGSGMGLRVRSCAAVVADLAEFARPEKRPGDPGRVGGPERGPNLGRPFNNPFGGLNG